MKGSTGRFYDITPLKKVGAAINISYGARSRGKTFQMLCMVISDFWEGYMRGEKRQSVYLRRRREDLKNQTKQLLFSKITDVADDTGNRILDITGGKFETAVYFRGGWYLANIDQDSGLISKMALPFMFDIALSSWYHDKGGSFESVVNLWFEEFVAVEQEAYLPGEFSAFQEVLSTVLRERENTYVWLMGNSIDFLCPYFENFGITDVMTQEPGTIRKYKLGRTKNFIAIERTNDGDRYLESKAESKYRFAFDSQDSDLIMSGAWQTGIFPLIPRSAEIDKDVCGRFLLLFKNFTLYGDIISNADENYIFFHTDPDPLHPVSRETDLVFSREFSGRQNYRRSFFKPLTPGEKTIATLINSEKVFFDSNVTGHVYTSYLKDCTK